MSKKRAVDYLLSYVHYRSHPQYVTVDFLDKKNKTMRSSVDVVINLEYFDEKTLKGFAYTR
jgi:hypothetical protein